VWNLIFCPLGPICSEDIWRLCRGAALHYVSCRIYIRSAAAMRGSGIKFPEIFTCDSVLCKIPFVLDMDEFTLEHRVILYVSCVKLVRSVRENSGEFSWGSSYPLRQ
jgi:hypothetical protein